MSIKFPGLVVTTDGGPVKSFERRKSAAENAPAIIMTRTPLRISFAGGGTDLPAYYRSTDGAVLSCAIDKYVYVTVKRHGALFNEAFRLNYSVSESTSSLGEVRNAIARECIRLLGIKPPLYISTIADLPSGSGLGSSAAFAVGLLNALHTYRGEAVSEGQLAEEACHVEIEILVRPVGKQDQYAAAYGGLNYFLFPSTGRVAVSPLTLTSEVIHDLFEHTLVFWTGVTRDSETILEEQKRKTVAEKDTADALHTMRGHAELLQNLLLNRFDCEQFGHVLDESWRLKRCLASGISTPTIDSLYTRAKQAGALGGKLCGAGGGGFLLLVAQKDRHDPIRRAMEPLSEIALQCDMLGTQVLFPSRVG